MANRCSEVKMTTIEWTGDQTLEPAGTGDVFVRAIANDKSVSVRVSREALEDFGMQRCMDVAERKILCAIQGAEPPPQVIVRTSDFR
jgi:hypothetical protein